MKQRLLALLCALVLLMGIIPSAAAQEGDALRRADTLATLNLVKGTGTDYALDTRVTRAQAAVLLVRLAGAQQLAEADGWISGFRDVPAWAHKEISYASRQKWVQGVTLLDFKPNDPVTANAWCTMLLRMLGYSDKAGDFTVHDAPAFARRIGLVSRSYSGYLTRGQVFETMYDALSFSYKDSDETVLDRLISSGTCTRAAAGALGLLDQELTARQIADRYMSAVFCMDMYPSQMAVEANYPAGYSSGFFISPDGLAVTNYHSIESYPHAIAILSNGESYPVEKVLYYDTDIDIAVIQVSRTSTEGKTASAFACLEMVSAASANAGDVVYTLGNPLGLGLAVSSGIISSVDRNVEGYTLPCLMNTADISQGSSGGALLNVYGQVIGVTTGAYAYGNNMYLAVPVDPAMTADLTVPGMTLDEVRKTEAEKLRLEAEEKAGRIEDEADSETEPLPEE